MTHRLKALDPRSRVWIFALNEQCTAEQEQLINAALDAFVQGWKSHGTPVAGAAELHYGKFVILGAQAGCDVSGCSIDSLTKAVRTAAAAAGLSLADLSLVQYRTENNAGIAELTRDDFEKLALSGTVRSGTIVFNNTVQTAGDLKEGRWECALKDSWHARAFPVVG